MKTLGMAALIVSLTTGGALASGVDYFTSFVGFGDSLSDKGRITTLSPPSLEGRFSNGPVWYDLIAGAFERRGLDAYNLALGGATAGPTNTNDPSYQGYDANFPADPSDPDSIPLVQLRNFDAQISSFVNAGFSAMVGHNPLVAVLLGGNDFLQDPAKFRTPQTVVNEIVTGIRRIAELGPAGTFDSFLVSNLPNFALSPGNAALPDAERAALAFGVQAYNAVLEANLEFLAFQDGLNIEVFDLFDTFNGVYVDAVAAGLTTNVPCTTALLDPAPPFNFCPTPESADAYLFIDDVHVNSFAQSRIGEAALAQIRPGLVPIPVPAGLPLLLAGIGAFAILRQRRAA